MTIITLDFETYGIDPAPDYPPKPVGLAYKVNDGPSRYTVIPSKMRRICETAARSGDQVLFHNAAFDTAVARKWLGVTFDPDYVNDTLFMIFLDDPRAKRFSLKPAAEHYLDVPPDEQDEVRDWILEHVPEATAKNWGYYIAHAPRKITAKYARGDVDRTFALYDLLLPVLEDNSMTDAYRTEIELVPLVQQMEGSGIRIARKRLARDLQTWKNKLWAIETRLEHELGQFNYNSGQQLANALEAAGLVDPSDWQATPSGQRATTRDALTKLIGGTPVHKLLELRSVYSHMINSFGDPWTQRMEASGLPRLFPRFNQVFGYHDAAKGTRTGRFSSSNPNFQQLNREPSDPALPFMRKYLLPDERDHVLLGRDFNQQELRILAHYENADMMRAYQDDPLVDNHTDTQMQVRERSGRDYERTAIKAVNFMLIYGGGAGKLAEMLGMHVDEARELKRLVLDARPGVKSLMKDLNQLSKRGEPVITRGGRIYYPEHGKEYRQLNTLIQGTAADHTKRAMLYVADAIKRYGARLMLTVHDEILVSCPREHAERCMHDFTEAMNFDYLDVPVLSDGKVGNNWGAMQ